MLAQRIEQVDGDVRFRRLVHLVLRTAVFVDGVDEIGRAAIVQEEDSLAEPPERRAPELVTARLTLADIVRQPRPHVVEQQIGEQVDPLVGERGDRRIARVEPRGVTQRTADVAERLTARSDRRGAPGVSRDGIGGARDRMKIPNCSMGLITVGPVVASVFVTVLGSGAN